MKRLFFLMFISFVSGAAYALTVAEKYGKSMQTTLDSKPTDFIVNGKIVASVTGIGALSLRDTQITQVEAVLFRVWIADNFMNGNNP